MKYLDLFIFSTMWSSNSDIFISSFQILVGWFSHYVVSDSCDPMDCSLPGSSIHGILQARILEWVAMSFSRGSSQPRNRTWVFCLQADFLPVSHKGSPRRLEWVAYPFSSRSSQPRYQTGVSCIAARFFTNWAIREALQILMTFIFMLNCHG